MNLHAFIFSNHRNYRLSRHALFWLIWILYYSLLSALVAGKSFGFVKSFLEALVEVAESTPLDMCFCYFIIYYLLPEFLFKGKYLWMLILWLAASIAFIVLYELNAIFLVRYIRDWFGMKHTMSTPINYTFDFFLLFSQINMEGCIAASIKLGKLWYVKQEEIDLLKQQKEKIEPHEEKGLMAPGLFTEMLGRLESVADTKPDAVAKSITKIRKLFTYMLYENLQAKLSLQKELNMLQEYISLEQITAYENVHVKTNIIANPINETIAPFIIIPFVENAFRQAYLQKLIEKHISIYIQLEHDILLLHLEWNKPADTSTLAQGRNVILQNVSKRLQLIYPQSHEIKTKIEVEKVIATLSIDLKKAIN